MVTHLFVVLVSGVLGWCVGYGVAAAIGRHRRRAYRETYAEFLKSVPPILPTNPTVLPPRGTHTPPGTPSNHFETPRGSVVVNGGDPVRDCPKSWDEIPALTLALNHGEAEPYGVPVWKFDCGFKLNFDGPLLSISSRFYPPKTGKGGFWTGSVCVGDIVEREFSEATLDDLHAAVEGFINQLDIVIRVPPTNG